MSKGYWIALYKKIENINNLGDYAKSATETIIKHGANHWFEVENMRYLKVTTFLEHLFGNFQVIKLRKNVIIHQNIRRPGI